MTTIQELLDTRLRTAKVAPTEDDVRRIKASLQAAGIDRDIPAADATLASAIVDKYIANMESSRTVMTCPRCSGSMVQVKLATRRNGNFCQACRVVTPA